MVLASRPFLSSCCSLQLCFRRLAFTRRSKARRQDRLKLLGIFLLGTEPLNRCLLSIGFWFQCGIPFMQPLLILSNKHHDHELAMQLINGAKTKPRSSPDCGGAFGCTQIAFSATSSDLNTHCLPPRFRHLVTC